MLSALKESVVVSFFRGAELADPQSVLEKPGKNSRFSRYIRFTNANEVTSLKNVVVDYVREAVELEKSGKKAAASNHADPTYPDELTEMFRSNPDVQKAFALLTPGRQRGYLIHFSSAKQSKTRMSRIEKCMPRILDGKGWNER